jgi:hypothetical protein
MTSKKKQSNQKQQIAKVQQQRRQTLPGVDSVRIWRVQATRAKQQRPPLQMQCFIRKQQQQHTTTTPTTTTTTTTTTQSTGGSMFLAGSNGAAARIGIAHRFHRFGERCVVFSRRRLLLARLSSTTTC